MSSDSLVVSRAGPAQAPIIANLMQLYIHDFSELWFDRAGEGELGPDGRYSGYPGLDTYWTDPTREPWLFRVDGLPVGLMLVGRHFDEETIYRAAYAFEQAGDWTKM